MNIQQLHAFRDELEKHASERALALAGLGALGIGGIAAARWGMKQNAARRAEAEAKADPLKAQREQFFKNYPTPDYALDEKHDRAMRGMNQYQSGM